jgi:prepilin-type N-terminal cleavage/methylation domain-containing protein
MRNRHAYTLIELLIVVAIISIISASSLGLFVLPMSERKFSDVSAEQLGAARMLFGSLVPDLHRSTELVSLGNGYRIVGDEATGGASTEYLVEGGILRRRVLPDGVAIILGRGVERFTLTISDDGRSVLLLFDSELTAGDHALPLRVERRLALGNAWMGGSTP